MTYKDTVEAIKIGLIDYFSGHAIPVEPEHTHHAYPREICIVLFMYSINDLFEEVKKITATIAKGVFDKNGKSLFDTYAVTEDERGIIDTFLRNGTSNLYSLFSPYSRIIFPSYLYDEGSVIPDYDNAKTYAPKDRMKYDGEIFECSASVTGINPDNILAPNYWLVLPDYVDTKGKIIIVMDYNHHYRDNVLKLVETKLPTSIISYVLTEWFKITGLNDRAISYGSEFAYLRDEIQGHLFSLKSIHRKHTDLC